LCESEADETNNDESSYNQLLFFDFECIQENGMHTPNLCVVHDEAGNEHVFKAKIQKMTFVNGCFKRKTRAVSSWLIISKAMTVILFYNICIVIQVIQVIQSDSK
jgi:hypothetical protein